MSDNLWLVNILREASCNIIHTRLQVRKSKMASYLRKSYLILYNAASAVAWATVLGRVIAVFLLRGPTLVPVSVDTFVRNTQSFAALEILHSLLGMCLYACVYPIGILSGRN